MAGSFILVSQAQGRSERGVFDRPFTLPVLIIPAFPLSGLNTTEATDPRPVLPALPKGCNHCHTDTLDQLVCVLIQSHTHIDTNMHP